MKNKTKILFLYTEVVGYLIPVFQDLRDNYNSVITVVNYDFNKLKPYNPENQKSINFYNRSAFDINKLSNFVEKFSPDIIYISGWVDKDYLKIGRKFRKRGIPVIIGFDDIWRGTIRQNLGRLYYQLFYESSFSHAWVSGVYQFEFAKKMGFKNEKIIFDLLSANTTIFNRKVLDIKIKNNSIPQIFVYAGNFRERKGFDILIKAYLYYKNELKGVWGLKVIGNGELEYLISDIDEIENLGFLNEQQILNQALLSGVFVLPSRLDQWGVVVHEFASMGFPLILSDGVGARSHFLIQNFNGMVFKNEDYLDLAYKMHEISQLSKESFFKYSERSVLLSSKINPTTTAANLMSVLTKY